MATSVYQPPPGIWKSTPARRLLWAVEQVLAKMLTAPEQKQVDTWALRIAQAFNKPVLAFNWEAWWLQVQKADEHEAPVGAVIGWDEIATRIVDELWPEAGETRTTSLALPFDPEDMQVALAGTSEQVVGIDDTMLARLRVLIADAYEGQTTQFGFARQMRTEFAEISATRSKLIAVTEWNRAASAATYLGYTEQGVKLKVWYTVGDDRVCAQCEANSAMGEIPMAEEFFTGDLYPPAHSGCRCNVSSA